MKNLKTLKASITSAILVFSSLACTETHAAMANWNLKFFDQTENTVGVGHFAYDPNTLSLIATSEAPTPDTISINNELTSFEASLAGLTWGLTYPTWWADDNHEQGFQVSSRYGIWIDYGRWLMGDPDAAVTLQMDNFTMLNDYLWYGEWDVEITPSMGGEPFSARGSFNAAYKNYQSDNTPVPLPASLPLFLSAAGIIGFVSRRRQLRLN